MELSEEKELAKITKEFASAVQIFSKKDYEKAENAFDSIIERYKDSDFYSVLEIQARSNVYKKICHAQLHPIEIELTIGEDYLNEGIYHLNTGNFDRALELLSHLEKNGYKDSYVNYLLSIVYLKKEDIDSSLEYLKKAVNKDQYYKIIAHNEPDFDRLFENEEFTAIIDMEQ
jgi:tetratricopeptide (TPR) repeat protein